MGDNDNHVLYNFHQVDYSPLQNFRNTQGRLVRSLGQWLRVHIRVFLVFCLGLPTALVQLIVPPSGSRDPPGSPLRKQKNKQRETPKMILINDNPVSVAHAHAARLTVVPSLSYSGTDDGGLRG